MKVQAVTIRSDIKTLLEVMQLRHERVGAGFSATGMRHRLLDPFMDVTFFSMSQPTFQPHPHAGFSAVTYMLPESDGGFTNRDSLGDTSRIGPGAIHWTQAAAGMVHEEIPEQSGISCQGFQMFVKLPAEKELSAPAAFHANPEVIKTVTANGWSARVLAGSLQGVASPLSQVAQDICLYDLTVEPKAQVNISVDDGLALWAMLISGDITLEMKNYSAPTGIFWSANGTTAAFHGGSRSARLLMGAGMPLKQKFQFSGPFAMSTEERLSDARRRYSQGAMGFLKPSF